MFLDDLYEKEIMRRRKVAKALLATMPPGIGSFPDFMEAMVKEYGFLDFITMNEAWEAYRAKGKK